MKGFAVGSLILMAMLAGCRVLEEEAPGADLIGVVWELEAFQRADGTEEPFGSQGMRLSFLPEGELTGILYMVANPSAEGIPYSSQYEVGADGSISIELPELEGQAGPLPRSSRWIDYQAALFRATSYEVRRNRLLITHNNGANILIFRVHSR